MRIKFKKGKQNWLLEKAISKAGSERKLKKITGIHNAVINRYRSERVNICDKRLNLMLNFLDMDKKDIEKFVERRLDENWGRKKGGKDLIKKHQKEGTYGSYLKHLRKRGKIVFSKMHKDMKRNDPEKYYKSQYEKFKKIGSYKFKTKRGEVVRNELEKFTADFLFSLKLDYQYEPYLKANGSAYFPDFKIGNLILECTAWRGYLKVEKLKKKLKDFEKEGYNVRFVIPQKIKKFYKPFKERIITDLNKASVAQTMRTLVR